MHNCDDPEKSHGRLGYAAYTVYLSVAWAAAHTEFRIGHS